MSRIILLAGVACLTACSTTRTSTPLPSGVQAISLLGDTLRTLPIAAETKAVYERELAQARAAWERTPSNPDSIIWYGRRLGYLGRIREAIDVYSRGIAQHPDNAWLYRHRGHRYLSVREIDKAITDFEKAANLVAGKPDEIEPDGRPNAQNRPIGTLHSNIDYHLALAHYLKGDFAKALPVYKREFEGSRNDDRKVSIAHWYYMALRRMGRDAEAAAVIAPITRQMDVIENETYHKLLLFYKGELPVDSLMGNDASAEMSVLNSTAAYGVGNWHLYNGRPAEARRVFERILAGGQWGAFGFIAAEAELARGTVPR